MLQEREKVAKLLKGFKLTPAKESDGKFHRTGWPLQLKLFVISYVEENEKMKPADVAIFFNQFLETRGLTRQSVYDWVADKKELTARAIELGVNVHKCRYRKSTMPRTEIALF
jgi:hypothetical protein